MSSDQITNGVKRQEEECVMPSSNGCATNKSTMTDTAMSSPLTKFLPKPQKVIKDYVEAQARRWILCLYLNSPEKIITLLCQTSSLT